MIVEIAPDFPALVATITYTQDGAAGNETCQ
jgi:hypothetical protein